MSRELIASPRLRPYDAGITPARRVGAFQKCWVPRRIPAERFLVTVQVFGEDELPMHHVPDRPDSAPNKPEPGRTRSLNSKAPTQAKCVPPPDA
jgi:hypothetical protein